MIVESEKVGETVKTATVEDKGAKKTKLLPLNNE